MTHSTGSEDRLNRLKNNNSDSGYAKEELIAELSAALMGFYMGMETTIRTDHASYLKGWLQELGEDSTFLMDVLSDVVQAVKFMCTHLQFNPFETPPGNTGIPVTGNATVRDKNKMLTDELAVII